MQLKGCDSKSLGVISYRILDMSASRDLQMTYSLQLCTEVSFIRVHVLVLGYVYIIANYINTHFQMRSTVKHAFWS